MRVAKQDRYLATGRHFPANPADISSTVTHYKIECFQLTAITDALAAILNLNTFDLCSKKYHLKTNV